VVTPARTCFANTSNVARATSATCLRPAQSAADEIDMMFS
jgi:hypothetical protein